MIDLQWQLINFSNSFYQLHALRFYQISVLFIFFIFVFCSLKPYLLDNKNDQTIFMRIFNSEYTYIATVFAFLLLARWPGFLKGHLNVDEQQFIAGAMKLLQDPIFWRSVDGTTSGPLNIYILTVPAFFGFNLDAATSRCVGLILVFIAVLGLYYSLRYLYSKAIARLSLIPVITTFALMREPDYIHYSSEHLSIAILSVALFIVCYSYSQGFIFKNIFVLGFLLGLTPFAKLQGTPISIITAIFFIHIFWIKKQNYKYFLKGFYIFILSFILPTLLVIIITFLFSIFDDFWKSYILQSVLYANNASEMFTGNQPSFLKALLIIFPQWWLDTRDTKALFVLTSISLLGLLFLRFKYNKNLSLTRMMSSDTAVLACYSLLILFASIFAVVKPGTFFEHYLLFLIIPCGFFSGVITGEIEKAIRVTPTSRKTKTIVTTVLIALAICSSSPLVFTGVQSKYFTWNQKKYHNYYDLTPLTQTILKHGSPGEYMAVWGWVPELYVDTGLVQATRDGNCFWQISPNTLQPYYIRRFVNDLANSKAKLFVDAVSPKMFAFHDRKTQGYESFPEVKKFVQENYTLIDEITGVRIYSRK